MPVSIATCTTPTTWFAHFHYVLSLGAVFIIFAAMYYWFPKMSGYMMPEWVGKVHFWIAFIGSKHPVLPDALPSALPVCPRRYADYPDAFAGWNFVASIGSYIFAVGVFVFLYGVYIAFRDKVRGG